ncbi:unnamed protein product [Polarella glacialis]|uniref:Uncharacterized protein n=1 Tax=Polarella glacialis TaxID=89957 RepID=A0A813F1A5_POLGL|nr:unnamed protein product [Polarella glacialis]CAE8608908.1 unnamed protein product [Polarella glacialis]
MRTLTHSSLFEHCKTRFLVGVLLLFSASAAPPEAKPCSRAPPGTRHVLVVELLLERSTFFFFLLLFLLVPLLLLKLRPNFEISLSTFQLVAKNLSLTSAAVSSSNETW